jgi:hypothetical protein
MRGALINTKTGLVENVIMYDENYKAPAGYKILETKDGSPGDTHDGKRFIRSAPALVEAGKLVSARDEKLAELQAKIDELKAEDS